MKQEEIKKTTKSGHTSIEWCPVCDREVEIPTHYQSKCPVCDTLIVACSDCPWSHLNCNNCDMPSSYGDYRKQKKELDKKFPNW